MQNCHSRLKKIHVLFPFWAYVLFMFLSYHYMTSEQQKLLLTWHNNWNVLLVMLSFQNQHKQLNIIFTSEDKKIYYIIQKYASYVCCNENTSTGTYSAPLYWFTKVLLFAILISKKT